MKNRDGSYKKILIDNKTLKSHGDFLRTNLSALKALNLPSQDFTTLYLILFLRIRHPKNWIQKKSKTLDANVKHNYLSHKLLDIIPETFSLTSWEKEKLNGLTAFTLFSNFNLKAIPQSINRAMINWQSGSWNLMMLEYIPGPRELLRLQVKNIRCITVITDPLKIDSLVLEKRDPLSFVLHDLMHADQFMGPRDTQKGQLGFYHLIDTIYDLPDTRLLLKNDFKFKNEFEYVTSDMNAYVIHLFKCLKSAIIKTSQTNNDYSFFDKLLSWWKMNESEKSSSHRLNTPDFNQDDEITLNTFFENSQEIYQ